MKRLKTIGIGSTLGVISIAGVVFLINVNNQSSTIGDTPKSDNKETSVVREDPIQKPVQEVSNPDTVVSPSSPVNAAQEAPKAPAANIKSVPTIDELKEKYGWQYMPTYVDNYIKYDPQYFDEDTRESAFQYMKDVAIKLNEQAGQELSPSIYFLWNQSYIRLGWVETGKRVGIDWSAYEQ